MSAEQPITLIHPDSLGDTLDSVNEVLFENLQVPEVVRCAVASWIADRQGLPGSYAGMFAPTEYDYAFGTLVFTGEAIRSGAATGHILGEEACAALYRMGGNTPEIREALKRARTGILRRLEQSEVQGQWSGVYCCGTCSVALWRHMLASGAADDARRIDNGMTELRRYRDGTGRWKRFPFYYTLLALSEIDHPAVREEVLYAGAVIERALRRLIKMDPEQQSKHDRRRKIVLERVLEKC
jgi:hypothetical protein